MKLSYPFDYYWKKHGEGKCPFCDGDIEQTFENYDIIYCSIYGGYLSIYQDAAFAGPEGDGYCRECRPTDPIRDDDFSVEKVEGTSPFRTVVKGQGFLCESCNHGVYFDKLEVFQVLFEKHDEKKCKHCTWHNQHSASNPIKKPSN